MECKGALRLGLKTVFSSVRFKVCGNHITGESRKAEKYIVLSLMTYKDGPIFLGMFLNCSHDAVSFVIVITEMGKRNNRKPKSVFYQIKKKKKKVKYQPQQDIVPLPVEKHHTNNDKVGWTADTKECKWRVLRYWSGIVNMICVRNQ